MCLDGCVCPFNGVLFDVSCSLILALGLWMFNFVELLSVNRDGGANNLGPRHLLNLSKIEQFDGEVCKPRSSEVWATLIGFKNAEKVNTSSAFPLLFFSLCTRFKQKLLFNSWDNVCA